VYDQATIPISKRPDRALFADPEWRGGMGERPETQRLRPWIHIDQQLERLANWIASGANYGWLGVYQARRAAFELRSIQAQIAHERAFNHGDLPDEDRRAVQARLDRLEQCLEAVREG
jgi:hypothetical protein